MSSTYTPAQLFKEGTEKDWPSKLGGLDWDFTRIVFTKRTLIEFLRYTGTSVDPGLHNIAKLPRYADFGHLEDGGEATVPGVSKAVSQGTSTTTNDDFKPSRRVRSVPGGAHSFSLGDGSDDPLDIPVKGMESLLISKEQPEEPSEAERLAEPPETTGTSGFKSTRRARTGPGGPSNMGNLWDDHVEPETFKPTRRVREGPGGVDSISQIF